MKYIPNVLSFSRIILSIVLFYLNPVKLPFIFIYIICGITDVLDGFIARKINAISEFGAKLDSVADILIISVILFKFIPILKLNFYMMIWIVVIALIKVSCIIMIFIRFKQFGMIHTYLNKLTGLLIFVYPILNYFIPCKFYMYLVFIVATATSIEEILICSTITSLYLDKKSYFK
ncbi:MAG: CDP-alcohol phosphatidyltransferase family protein [Intestinibacter sp.]|uniref:CDP-alcohol phosphatidyltransferase family protein n=1 Tax=Intestinibacter sp. TaxID=1965304 RepID=UPI003F146F51